MVKLRNVRHALGFASVPREYPTSVVTFDLPSDGEVRFARWLHPAETPKTITQAQIDALRAFLPTGDMAIDIGAHTGDSTLPMVFGGRPSWYGLRV